MKTYITTIEELKSKTRRELNAIFKKASEVAATVGRESPEKEAALRTLEGVRRSLNRFDGP